MSNNIFIPFLIAAIIIGILVWDLHVKSKDKKTTVERAKENISLTKSDYIFGIDVSHYQELIDWKLLCTTKHPIQFVFIRATMGINGKDIYFEKNWKEAKKHNFLRGAYHYFRPNENGTKQFEQFKQNVKLEKGDFYPVLDIEQESILGRIKLRKEVMEWLKLAEEHYGVKPIVYTGIKFYEDILKGHLDGYPLWIAAYSGKHKLTNVNWTFHQFTEKVKVNGINGFVDGNDFNGRLQDLKSFQF